VRPRAWLLAVGFVGSVLLANVLTTHYGLVPAGFGLLVPAGTYAAGLCLGLRDELHEAGGVRWVLAAITAGAVLSVLLADARIALASGAAFLLAELVDLAVYTPLRRAGRRRAVVISNAVGAVVDTLVFLALAGFPLTGQSVGGQLLVKAVWATAAVLLAAEVVRRAVLRHPVRTEGA
jgi:queuosine precursor transporter